ncbi:MAG: hypothetical protein GY857_12420, partial [Desulfobacula sp.]|nr:hypothetical protein [Desulfobacula sp.]
MKKSVYISVIVIGVLFFAGTTVQAKTWMARYYEKNPMGLDQLTTDYGSPLNTIEMEDGVKKMIFGPKDVMIGYTYFLVKDGMVLDRNITDTLGKSSMAKKSTGPVAEGLMA